MSLLIPPYAAEPAAAGRGPARHGERDLYAAGVCNREYAHEAFCGRPKGHAGACHWRMDAGREPAWDRGATIPPLRTPPVRRKEIVTVTLIGTVIFSDGERALIEVTEVPGVRHAIRVWVGQAEAARV